MASLRPTEAGPLYIGLMSGTSLDGVDGVLFDAAGLSVAGHVHAPFPAALRDELLALNTPGDDELHRAALAANAVARSYADVVSQLLEATGTKREQVAALGAHGQTVRHRPDGFDGYRCDRNLSMGINMVRRGEGGARGGERVGGEEGGRSRGAAGWSSCFNSIQA